MKIFLAFALAVIAAVEAKVSRIEFQPGIETAGLSIANNGLYIIFGIHRFTHL